MTKVVVILPCRGRHEQTLECVRRMVATAGLPHNDVWKMVLVGGSNDEEIVSDVSKKIGVYGLIESEPQLTYWTALQRATNDFPAEYYACIANDLLPVVNWLSSAVHKMQTTFSDGIGMVGFNGDGHPESHSAHFLISKTLLDSFGGWPVWYSHNFGDTELCIRARNMGRYTKSPWSVLFHNHPWISAHADDEVYAQGRSRFSVDQALFTERQNNGWK